MTPALRIVTSAAYVEQELAAEFGKIPPAFLPIGVSRLYEAQIALLGPGSPVHLTIPERFVPQPFDQARLAALDVVLVPVPEGLPLGQSIVYAINYIDAGPGGVTLLHGDTLIEDIPDDAADLIAVQAEGDDYSWAAVDVEDGRVRRLEVLPGGPEDRRPVACGYFAFSSSNHLVSAITRARGDFIGGLNLYAQDRDLRAAPVRHWRDFGHIQTYFRSRRAITTARAFNTLQIDALTVRKSSADNGKIAAEAGWFAALPPAVQPYSARLVESGTAAGEAFYRTEYTYAPTLAELFVFSSIGRPSWCRILRSCQDFLAACAGFPGPGAADRHLHALAVGKTHERLEQYARTSGFAIDRPTSLDGRALPSLTAIAEQMAAEIDLRTGRAETVMHGDLCFSNILYDSRAGRITVIDPRGHVRPGEPSIYGDARYDLAKLSHSVAGYYDHILAGRYALQRDASHRFAISFQTSANDAWLQQEVGALAAGGTVAGSTQVRAITIGLFLSMLPLHADRPDRQCAFIANALRLYAGLDARVGQAA